MIKKVIFLLTTPFTQSYYDLLGMDVLQKSGFEIEVWSLEKVVHGKSLTGSKPPDLIVGSPLHKVFSDRKNALESISALPADTFVIPIIGYFYDSYPVFRALSKSAAGYGLFMANTVPFPIRGRLGFFDYYLKRVKKLSPKKLFSRTLILGFLFRWLNFLWPKVKPPKLIFTGGENYYEEFYPMLTDSTEILRIHSLDYDNYLRERVLSYTPKNTTVFLDCYAPFHPDCQYMGLKPMAEAETYYPQLNRFFSRLEKDLGLRVVIAAHPRSDYESHPDYFGGRECIRGETVKLIKESSLVLNHASTAAVYANVFYKPVIFITSKEIDSGWGGADIWAMAEAFGKKPVFIDNDDPVDWKKELAIDEAAYESYRNKYIKTKGSEDLLFWQVVGNRLKKGF